MLRAIISFLAILTFFSCQPDLEEETVRKLTPFLNIDTHTTDSTLHSMTLKEKIGQLIFLKTNLKKINTQSSVFQWINDGFFGGVLLEDLDLDQYIEVKNKLDSLSKLPLFHGTQQNVLLNNQFKDLIHFPLPPSIGAVQNDTIYRELESLFLDQCNALGINFCVAPSTNRTQLSDHHFQKHVFENDSLQQIKRAVRVIRQMEEQRLISVGNTFSEFYQIENDSTNLIGKKMRHQTILAENGLSGFVIDDRVFQVDSLQQYPVYFMKKYLKTHMDFDGLLIGEINTNVALEDLLYAGADIFIVRDSVDLIFEKIHQMVVNGDFPEALVDEKVSKILLAKTYAGLDQKPAKVNYEKASTVLKNEHFKYNSRQLFERSITLAQNHNNLLPYTKTYQRNFRIVNIGDSKLKVFKEYFAKYSNYKIYNHPMDKDGILKPLRVLFYKHSTSVVVLDNLNLDPSIHKEFIQSINDISKNSKLTIINFGSPLNLQFFDESMSLIQVYEKNKITESIIPQLLFGGTSAEGKLPITLNDRLVFGKKIKTPITRLKYTVPQEVGIFPEKLVGIDAVIQSAIDRRATPGAQVLVVKNGKVFYNKSFGHHTYKEKQKVRNSDLFDLASVTKITATSLAAMKLYEQKKFKLGDRVRDHFDLIEKAKIGRITFKQLLTHSSGLQANMPISKYYKTKGFELDTCSQYFCYKPDENYSLKIADSMYFNHIYLDTLWETVQKIRLKRRGRYRYSDVNFYILQKFIEQETKQRLDVYLDENFYKPLNLRRTSFNPWKKIDVKRIVPTENDTKWRRQLLRGFVHDEAASLSGGVGGNSGLFSNANDLAVLLQMLLNGGTYGEQNFVKPKTVKQFTTAKYGNHRGLGFVVKGRRGANSLSSKASRKSYGHNGFTGTCVWVDPENELIYIFLSSRIHPKKENTKLFRKQTRRRIHDVVYKALDSYETKKASAQKMFVDL